MIFEYRDERGVLLYTRDHTKRPKTKFYDRDGNVVEKPTHCRIIPYRLAELITAKNAVITSNEYTADQLSAMGITATTCLCAGSAGSYFSGKNVVVLSLNKQFSERMKYLVTPYAASLRIIGTAEIADLLK